MRLSIDELCAKYQNENSHTEQVTAHALRLFDATHRWLKLPASDRPLLEAAGRLHDVGYSVNPERHPAVSSSIVLHEGLKGFSAVQRALICEIMPLHSGRWRSRRTLSASPHALRLGALLRIGDGLDYGHAQDADIVDVRHDQRIIRVTVHCETFAHARVRANAKADLWRSVFPFDIQFLAPDRERLRLVPVAKGLHRLEVARRVLWIQYKTVLANIDGAVARVHPEPLHELRVALRRARTLLRLMEEDWPKARLKLLQRSMEQAGDALGPARDGDVWMELLRSDGIWHAMENEPGWSEYFQRERSQKHQNAAQVVEILRGTSFDAFRSEMNTLLRGSMAKIKFRKTVSWKKWVQRILKVELHRVHRLRKLRHSVRAEDMHRLRTALRRARYVAEFGESAKLARRLHQCERPLAAAHDLDIAMGRTLPARLSAELKRMRRKELQKLCRSWSRLQRQLR